MRRKTQFYFCLSNYLMVLKTMIITYKVNSVHMASSVLKLHGILRFAANQILLFPDLRLSGTTKLANFVLDVLIASVISFNLKSQLMFPIVALIHLILHSSYVGPAIVDGEPLGFGRKMEISGPFCMLILIYGRSKKELRNFSSCSILVWFWDRSWINQLIITRFPWLK